MITDWLSGSFFVPLKISLAGFIFTPTRHFFSDFEEDTAWTPHRKHIEAACKKHGTVMDEPTIGQWSFINGSGIARCL